MSDERDPIEELRDAWRALPPPDATPQELDARTRAAVDWMRAAWAALEPPQVLAPHRLAARRRLRRAAPFAFFIAAAAALFVLALLAGRPRERTEVERSTAISSEAAPADSVIQTSAPPTALAALQRENGGIELRRGSVRLILLQPEPVAVESGAAR